MTLVNCKEEIDDIRPYKEYYNLTKYPKRYPAFVDFIQHDGGLGGDYYTMEILEIPENVKCVESFIMGRTADSESWGEDIFKKK